MSLAQTSEAQPHWMNLLDQEQQALFQQLFFFEHPDSLPNASKLFIEITSAGVILVDETPLARHQLATQVLSFLGRLNGDDRLLATFVVDWSPEAEASRATVQHVVGDLFAAYALTREQAAVERFGKHLIELPAIQRAEIENAHPLRIIPYPVVNALAPRQANTEQEQKGPSWEEVKPRNRRKITLKADGKIRIDDTEIRLDDLQPVLADFISNPSRQEDLATQAADAYLFIEVDREAKYSLYVKMLDVIRVTYQSLWHAAADKRYGIPFERLTQNQQAAIKEAIPMNLRGPSL